MNAVDLAVSELKQAPLQTCGEFHACCGAAAGIVGAL